MFDYKKTFWGVLMLIHIFSSTTYGANNLQDKKYLGELLAERKTKFESYFESLEKRSGIFGNKTKKDLQNSNEVLAEIVRTDNRIISTLNRVIDFRDFEKVRTNYDQLEHNSNYQNVLNANDTLTKRLASLTAINKNLRNENLIWKWIIYPLIAALILMVVLYIRRKG